MDKRSANEGTPTPLYNPILERLVRADDDIEGFIAYGLYKFAKREWSVAFTARNGAGPDTAALQAYHLSWTDTALKALRENAEGALSAFAQNIVAAEQPTIEAQTLRTGRPIWKDVLIAVASAFTYSLLLLLAALIIRYIGVDLVEVARGGKHEAPAVAAPRSPAAAERPIQPPHT